MDRIPLVSIAMCTYNGAKYLEEQLNSLSAQSYSNLEIIIVDDGSTDDTVEILRRYQTLDPRINLYFNETNLGFINNFSKAISLCTGDYIALADQDDIWKKEKIQLFLDSIGDNVLIYSDAMLIDELGNPMAHQLIRPEHHLVDGRCNKTFLFLNCVSGNTLMFKKELLGEILPIPDVSYHDVWIAYVASSLGTIKYTDEPMIYYRRHEEQVTLHPIKKKDLYYFKTRIRQKIDEKIKFAEMKLRDFRAFYRFSQKIDDEEMVHLLSILIDHYERYGEIIINFRLRKFLVRYKDEIYAIVKSKKRLTRAKRAAYGLKYYLYTLFI